MTNFDQHDKRKGSIRLLWWFPLLERENRLDLVARFEESARWSVDFVIMMGLATALASLGLLQNATPVVIGAMLVAPLMSPLIGAGFALVQGNVLLFRDSMKAMWFGIAVGLAIAFVLGLFTPEYEPTLEIQARGGVNLLDLGIALASGMAGAYAMARPNVAAILSGVAIAAALVPPLAVVGIAAAGRHFFLAGAAGVLFITNLVAIVLGAASVFRMLGVQASFGGTSGPAWARRLVLMLILASILLVVPLGNQLLTQARLGQERPVIYPASLEVRQAVLEFIKNEPGVEVVIMGRSALTPESGVHVLLACDGEVPPSLKKILTTIIRDVLEEEVPVRVITLQTALEKILQKETNRSSK